ncbi:MAG: SDR family oxidoreductase [Xenococcaceae cyanobacterium MO_188.B32]|nr:SDR family oxidoreductase [Xenococcaceae cyanobacterium MO_188.B32]
MNSYIEQLFSLQDRVAIVTGASRGIGAGIAKGLAQAGAKTYGTGRSEKPEWESIENLHYKRCDVSKAQEILKLCQELYEEHGRLDILVNAAGITLPLKDTDTLEERLTNFDRTIEVDLRAPYAGSMAAAPYMAKSGGGSIINITSINSIVGFPGNPGYVAAKGGLRLMTKGLAMDLIKDNIRVNNIAPGYIETSMTKASFSNPETYEQRLRHMIVPRWGQPEDLVGATIYLASDASAYVTGQDIFVDGGWTAKGMIVTPYSS